MSSFLDRPRESALPSKLFFRIGEVASLVGVEPHVLRYWEREFRSIRPTKSAKGQRVYSRKDVENLLRVRDLLYRDGFTIAGAKKRLQRGGASAAVAFADGDGSDEGRAEPDGADADVAFADGGDGEATDADATYADALAEPRSGPRAPASGAFPAEEPTTEPSRATLAPPREDVREKLTALRAEVEAFLDELESDRI